VYFNNGEYQPESGEGKRLLAHELTHVVQQGEQSQKLQRQEESETAPTSDPCSYAGEAVKEREVHLRLSTTRIRLPGATEDTTDFTKSAVRVYTRGGSHVQFDNVITGPSTEHLAGCHMYSVKGHQPVSGNGLINFVNYCGGFGFHSNFWRQSDGIARIPGSQSHGCARLHDTNETSTGTGDSKRFYDLVQNSDCVRIYIQPFWRAPTFKRCPSDGESC
jgi:hypothetical protein